MPLKPGWQLKEEVPMFVILFVIVAIVMQFYNIGNLEQKFATAFLVAAISVSMEVILTGKHKK